MLVITQALSIYASFSFEYEANLVIIKYNVNDSSEYVNIDLVLMQYNIINLFCVHAKYDSLDLFTHKGTNQLSTRTLLILIIYFIEDDMY